jgi:hypothetical protein
MNTNWTCIALVSIVASLAGFERAQQPTAPLEPAAVEPRVGVRFEGFLPGTHDEKLQGEFAVDFRIYLSPQGGEAIWSESQKVKVVDGRMDVVLGAVTAIPMSIHEATFKFLGAAVGGAREVYPRFTIVNTVYVSLEEALRPPSEARPIAERRPGAAHGEVYAAPGAKIAAHSEAACTWKQALLAARKAGADLADYQDWYAALAHCTKDEITERSGHYEWVLPWVYDTASHGDYNRLFRGRFQGCDYMDLSPTNAYVYRLATPVVDPSKKSEAPPKK